MHHLEKLDSDDSVEEDVKQAENKKIKYVKKVSRLDLINGLGN